jgi:hypothetical protein
MAQAPSCFEERDGGWLADPGLFGKYGTGHTHTLSFQSRPGVFQFLLASRGSGFLHRRIVRSGSDLWRELTLVQAQEHVRTPNTVACGQGASRHWHPLCVQV